VVAAREQDRGRCWRASSGNWWSSSKGRRAALRKQAFQVASDSDFKELAKALAAEGIKSDLRSDDLPAPPNCSPSRTTRARSSRCSPSGTISRRTSRCSGSARSSSATARSWCRDVQQTCDFYERCGLQGVRLERRLLRVHALQSRPPHGEFPAWQTRAHAPYRVRGARLSAVEHGCDVLSHHHIRSFLGAAAPRAGTMSRSTPHPDQHVVEFFAELDQILDEELGYFDPRPWHTDRPSGRRCGPATTARSPAGSAADRGLSSQPR